MGFCRRCGDIVSSARCKCGGLAVRASVDFSQTASNRAEPDLWSRTYVRSTSDTPSPLRERSTTLPTSTPRPFIDSPRLSRPQSTSFSRSALENPILSHIESESTTKPPTPVKTGAEENEDKSNRNSSPDDILFDPDTSVLSKAYGSVLQPKESLSIFTCFACSSPFPPDATIYPDPNDPTTNTRFLCRPCFAMNGGAKGDCASCEKPVLILSSEGGFIENAGRIWHRRCFRCDGCFKDIGGNPIIDLLGRPSCEDCFDSCLKRPRTDSMGSRRVFPPTDDDENRSNLGGMKRGTSREGSPAMDELHQRLGIKTRESSPLVDRVSAKTPDRDSSPIISEILKQRMSELNTRPVSNPGLKHKFAVDSPSQTSDASPKGRYEKFRLTPSKAPSVHSPSPRAKNNIAEEMERRIKQASSFGARSISPVTATSSESISGPPSTPDLTDNSDWNATFSPPSTPSNSPPEQNDSYSTKTPTKPSSSQAGILPSRMALSSPSTPCAKCSNPLFRTRAGGKFVTVPEESSKQLPPKSYHIECFRCDICDDPFEETKNGQAVFVRSSSGCCHVGCATPKRILIRPMREKSNSISLTPSPTKQNWPSTAPPIISTFPRFGRGVTCPGCHISVSPMERGVVPGPQGSRWHASCLVCGGKSSKAGPRRDPNTPGCGKRLDSAAKTDGEGGVWCRECLLFVDSPTKPDSPVKPLAPSYTGGNIFNRFNVSDGRKNEAVAPQLTGTTTIARQFTGMGAITRQLTGSGLNPTRQLPRDSNRSPSPTKGFMLNSSIDGRRVPFPRPKSVGGIRGKSMDEGRGMFLVRQLTGGGSGELQL